MKKIILALLVAALAAGCTARTEYGECVGIAEEKDPNLVYRLEMWNLFEAAIFVETFVAPAVVILDRHSCPVGKKGEPL